MKKMGALPSQRIADLIDGRFILDAKKENIKPASLDMTISDEVYRLESVFLPKPIETIRTFLEERRNNSLHNLKYPLERGVAYLAKLNEELSLPEMVYGYCNPKSSTGRNDVHVRVLADEVSVYDTIPLKYDGELWMIIQPKSYPVLINPGESLSQIRFFNQDTRFDETELQISFQKDKLLWSLDGKKRPFSYDKIKIKHNDGTIVLTLDLKFSRVVGYECRESNKVVNLSAYNLYDLIDFFNPITVRNESIHLKKGRFYILSTREAVRVPPHLACEMVPMHERNGEFRSHYAGFIDPGWGYGKNGEGAGRPLTLEVRPFEDMVIRDNQPIANIRFERMSEVPEISYDNIETSNYIEQSGPRLAKQFKK